SKRHCDWAGRPLDMMTYAMEVPMTVRPTAVSPTQMPIDLLPCVHPNAAGLHIGADEIYACVPSDRDVRPVRVFATFTADLHLLADWLLACGIDTVAMESTGIYWLAIYEILEARGIRVFLVNARQIKIPAGRKS